MNLNEFSRRMIVIAGGVAENVEDSVRRCALAVDQTVTMATPVDTGRARANWVVGLATPNRAEVVDFPSGRAGSTGGAAGAAAIARARQTINQYKSNMQAIWVSNNLPYIQRLNEGWSAQAPAGFVEQAMEAGVRVVRGARVLRGV